MPDSDRFLGKYLKEAYFIEKLANLSSSSAILETVLGEYDDEALFCIALHSSELWGVVSAFLAKETRQPMHSHSDVSYAGAPSTYIFPLQHLPIEIRTRLLRFMDLRMLHNFGSTCKGFHRVVNQYTAWCMKRSFVLMGLSWPSIRFMLDQTSGVIAGYQVNRLLFPGYTSRGLVPVEVLDVFIYYSATEAVVKFFEVTSGFKRDSVKKRPSPRISSTITLVHRDPAQYPIKIAVHVTVKDEWPHTAVFRQSLTCKFAFIDGRGLIVPYAALTFEGTCIVNHENVSLEDDEDKAAFKKVTDEANQYGVQVNEFHSNGGGCQSENISCPTPIRTTLDDSCFSLVFHDRVWGVTDNGRVMDGGVAWSFGANGCDGTLNTAAPFVAYLELESKKKSDDRSNRMIRVGEEEEWRRLRTWEGVSMASDKYLNRDGSDVYLVTKLHSMLGSSEILDEALQAYSEAQLFRIALASPNTWAIIKKFLKAITVQRAGSSAVFGASGLSTMPLEMLSEMLHYMDIRDLDALGRTCNFFRRAADKHRNKEMKDQFRAWDLDFDETVPIKNYKHTVDFYVHANAARAVLRFFKITSRFKKTSEVVPHISSMVSRILEMDHDRPELIPIRIRIMVCARENPRATILRQDLTGLFTWMSGSGFFVPYADLTFNGLSLLNHHYLPLTSIEEEENFQSLELEAKHHGIHIQYYHCGEESRCTGQLSCPAVVRNTRDGSCFATAFSDRIWGSEQYRLSEKYGVIWSLGGKGCDDMDVKPGFFVNVFENKVKDENEDTIWLTRMAVLLHSSQ
ncbi:hypothetical protein B0H11DRAFT_1898692 [Mycena galericulata]|nr:hypothetical protein B0H11DRAFT_1898692 [Mycena galericulata]